MASFVIGGVALPCQKAAQAQYAVFDAALFSNSIYYSGWDQAWQGMKLAWEKVSSAYHAAADWISANVATSTWLEGKLEKAIDSAWAYLKKKLLDMLVNDIIVWIQGGGEPKIISDFGSFLRDAADQAGGSFITSLLQSDFLCSGFGPRLNVALSRVPTFGTNATCTISQINSNIEGFFDNFEQGGWNSFLAMTEPQNNIYGAYLMGLDELIGRKNSASQSAQAQGIAGSGFLNDEVCDEITMPDGTVFPVDGYSMDRVDIAGGETCTKKRTRTPGRMIADAASKASLLDIDYILGIDKGSMATYVTAIVDAMVNRIIREGVTMVTTSGQDSSGAYYVGTSAGQTGNGITTSPIISINSVGIDTAISDRGTATALIDQEKLLRENYEKLVAELQTNLSIASETKIIQENTIKTAVDLLNKGCSLPAGATLTSEGSAYKLKVDGAGEAILNGTTNPVYGYNPNNTTYTITSLSLNAASLVQSINNKITATQDQISKVATATSDTQSYVATIERYITAYNNWQNNNGTQAQVEAAQVELLQARDNDLTSLRALLGLSSAADLQTLLQKTQEASNIAVQEINNEQTNRGLLPDCAYAGNGLYRDRCSAQSTYSTWQSNLSYCEASLNTPVYY